MAGLIIILILTIHFQLTSKVHIIKSILKVHTRPSLLGLFS